MKADSAAAFREHVLSVMETHGRSVTKIADAIIDEYCPRAYRACIEDGVEKHLRNGVANAVRSIVQDHSKGNNKQHDFAEIEESFGAEIVELVKRLRNDAHCVPSLGVHLTIRELLEDRERFDEARKYKRKIGEDTLEEAHTMDQIYFARWPE